MAAVLDGGRSLRMRAVSRCWKLSSQPDLGPSELWPLVTGITINVASPGRLSATWPHPRSAC